MTTEGLLEMTGIVQDKGKGVTMPQTRLHNALLPQEGTLIGHDWKVGADAMNVILFRRRKTKNGKEQWATEGYFGTVGEALVALVRQGVRDTELASVQAVQDKITGLNMRF